MRARRAAITACAFFLLGCGNRGLVTFSILEPAYQPLNPITAQVTEYAVKTLDGSVVAVASPAGSSSTSLSLGPLMPEGMPIDLRVDVLSGAELLGMARLRDVQIENGVQHDYAVNVRKPLITIGSTVPPEMLPGNLAIPGQLIDTSVDPAHQDLAMLPNGPKLPPPITATGATWDGLYILAGSNNGITVLDTGSGNKVGTVPLNFAPARIAVGPRNSAIAVLNAGAGKNGMVTMPGSLTLFADVGGLTSNPSGASGMNVPLSGMLRTITFSPDGNTVYVLTDQPASVNSGGADPCSPSAGTVRPNSLVAIGIDGSMQGTWMFSGFVADITVDEASGQIIVSDATDNFVGAFDPRSPFGGITPAKLSAATCPNGLRSAQGEVFVLTNKKDIKGVQNETSPPPPFELLEISLKDGSTGTVDFASPVYSNVSLGDMPTPDNNTKLQFQFTPASITATDMAITPDATRLVVATRARYHEANAALTVFTNKCTATFDIVEYGVYSLDTRTGQSSYTSRSQIVGGGAGLGHLDACIDCTVPFGGDVPLPCDSNPGDQAAGIAAVFGGP